jgi:hypothetical protein
MAKYRQGFVSNSSSSSFVIIEAGEHLILEHGDTDITDDIDSVTMSITELIGKLMKAKDDGVVSVTITHGGGYEG